jgi:hypothetical protein
VFRIAQSGIREEIGAGVIVPGSMLALDQETALEEGLELVPEPELVLALAGLLAD